MLDKRTYKKSMRKPFESNSTLVNSVLRSESNIDLAGRRACGAAPAYSHETASAAAAPYFTCYFRFRALGLGLRASLSLLPTSTMPG